MRFLLQFSVFAAVFGFVAAGCDQQAGGGADVKTAKNAVEPKCPFCDEGEKPDADEATKVAATTQAAAPKTQDSGLKTADSGLKTQDPGLKTADSGPKTQDSGLKTADPSPLAWPAPTDREELALDFNFTDQDGKPFNLKTIKGKPTVATFIFTRCANPQMCPLQAMKMAELQKQAEKAGVSDRVNLLLITFDPEYDTPDRLKEFAERNGVKFTNARALRPDPREFQNFRFEFRFRMGYSDKGEINHKTDLFVLDHEGRLTRPYAGMWEDGQVFDDVKKLLAEMTPPAK